MFNKKGQIQIPFAWLFAIIVGAFILFLAIYSVTKIVGFDQQKSNAEINKEFESFLNPLETGPESGSSVLIEMPVETRINNSCSEAGDFGEQRISLSQKFSKNKWSQTEIERISYNRYIFSEKSVEGKKFFVFTKPLNLPFKVGDLMYLTSDQKQYCFVNPPEKVEEEILDLSQENLLINECSEKSVKVCFEEGSNCDVFVNEDEKSVEKNRRKVYYETNALMYSAIFSELENYECQLKRIVSRTKSLLELYQEKSMSFSGKGCRVNVNLNQLASSLNNFESSENFFSIYEIAKIVERENDDAECKLW